MALASRDIKLDGRPSAGQLCKGSVIVHNIGSADAEHVMVRLVAVPAGAPDGNTVLLEARLDKLAFPSDLIAKRAAVDFQWTPKRPTMYRLEALVHCGDGAPEIYLGNNTASTRVSVADPSQMN